MADYKLKAEEDGGGIKRTSDGADIPPEPKNADWADYLAWVDAGGTADPAD